MNDCKRCVFATWDYEEYYDGAKSYFVDGCRYDNDPDECNDYEEEMRNVCEERDVRN